MDRSFGWYRNRGEPLGSTCNGAPEFPIANPRRLQIDLEETGGQIHTLDMLIGPLSDLPSFASLIVPILSSENANGPY